MPTLCSIAVPRLAGATARSLRRAAREYEAMIGTPKVVRVRTAQHTAYDFTPAEAATLFYFLHHAGCDIAVEADQPQE